jgi:hypothetical protein
MGKVGIVSIADETVCPMAPSVIGPVNICSFFWSLWSSWLALDDTRVGQRHNDLWAFVRLQV